MFLYFADDSLSAGDAAKVIRGLNDETRSINGDCDHMWHAWYMIGDPRARDVALLFGELKKHDFVAMGAHGIDGRGAQTPLTAALDMYEATFDPWFLAAALAAGDLKLDRSRISFYEGEIEHQHGSDIPVGHGSRTGTALPLVLAVLERASQLPAPVHCPFLTGGRRVSTDGDDFYAFRLPQVLIRKTGSAAVPLFFDHMGRGRNDAWPPEPVDPYDWNLAGPRNVSLSGTWRAPVRIDIPIDAPAGDFIIDPQNPPYFSISRAKLLNPEE